VFRVGEVYGRETGRIRLLADMLGIVDGTRTTTNLWGERWSKLCHNAMRNGIAAATGLSGREIDQVDHIRNLTLQLGAVTIGRALGYELERIGKLDPDLIVQAAAGNPQAADKAHAILIGESGAGGRGALQRPSMGQDMVKGRRTEIEEINGFIVRKGEAIGIRAPHNAPHRGTGEAGRPTGRTGPGARARPNAPIVPPPVRRVAAAGDGCHRRRCGDPDPALLGGRSQRPGAGCASRRALMLTISAKGPP